MSDHAEFKSTVASKGAVAFCHEPEIKGLTSEQLYALHLCKHEMTAAVYRLYSIVPPKKSDPLLKKYFCEIGN